MKLRGFFRGILGFLVTVVGSNLRDYRTGETIARAIVVGWGGKIHLLGLRGRDQVIPVFLPQHKMSFWKRSIGFTVHPRPDFPRERGEGPSS
jgi:hypothetical protein